LAGFWGDSYYRGGWTLWTKEEGGREGGREGVREVREE